MSHKFWEWSWVTVAGFFTVAFVRLCQGYTLESITFSLWGVGGLLVMILFAIAETGEKK